MTYFAFSLVILSNQHNYLRHCLALTATRCWLSCMRARSPQAAVAAATAATAMWFVARAGGGSRLAVVAWGDAPLIANTLKINWFQRSHKVSAMAANGSRLHVYVCVCVDQATFLASQSLGSASGELFQLIYVCVYVCIYLAICRRFDLVHHNAPQRHLLTAWRQFNCCFYVYLIFLAKNSLKLWQLLAIKTVFVYTLYP